MIMISNNYNKISIAIKNLQFTKNSTNLISKKFITQPSLNVYNKNISQSAYGENIFYDSLKKNNYMKPYCKSKGLNFYYAKKNYFSNNSNKMNSRNYFDVKKIKKDIILTPKEGYNSVLIFMHGLGDSAEGYLDLFCSEYRPTPNKMKVVLLTAPTAPVTINGGMVMTSWYDILSFEKTNEDSISKTDVIENCNRIKEVIEAEAKAVEINSDYKKIFLGGFSQGCCMALYSGLTHKTEIGGIIGLSGLLFPFCELNEDKKNLPIFLAHGKYDEVIPSFISEESYKRFKNAKFNFNLNFFEDGHTVELETLNKVKNFLSNLVPKF